MIGDWIAQAPVLGLAVLVVFLPGLLILAALRLRGLLLWATAPGVSVTVLSLLALVFGRAGVRWGHLSVGVAVGVIALAAWALSRTVRAGRWRPAAGIRWQTGLLGGGLVVGAGLTAARLMTYIGTPDALSQTNDAVFHLNALRWVELTGSASSLDLTGVLGHGAFYPGAWHAVTSLVALDTGMIPIAANMVTLVIGAAIWPLGIALLTRRVTGGRAVVPALAAALSGGLLAFPQLMFEWGVLYPYALSVALVPGTAAAAIAAISVWVTTTGRERVRASAATTVAAVAGAIAVAFSQPSSLLLLGLIVLLWMTGLCTLREVRTPRLIGMVVAAWIAFGAVWLVMLYWTGPVLWRAYRSVPGAVADVVLNAHAQLPAAIGMSMLMVIGLVVAVRTPRLRWLVAGWVIASLLYVISVATDIPILTRLFTGAWYGDSFRLAAIVPVFVVPLAAVGLAATIRWASGVLSRRVAAQRRWAAGAITVVAVIGTVGVIVAPMIPLRVAAEWETDSRYTLGDDSYLSRDEYTLLRELPALLEEDALLIANPSTGAAFAFVLGERDIVPRTWSPPQTPAWEVLADRLHDAASDAEVCEALLAYGSPGYVLDFGPGDTRPGQWIMPGMTDFDGRAGFEEVAREGEASLWRITACD